MVGSKLLRKNSKYHVVVTPHNIVEPEKLQLKIRSTNQNAEKSDYFETEQNVTITGDAPKIVEFDVSWRMQQYILEFWPTLNATVILFIAFEIILFLQYFSSKVCRSEITALK